MTPARLLILIVAIGLGLAVASPALADPLPPQMHTVAGGGTCSGSAMGGTGQVPVAGQGPAASGGGCDNKPATSVMIGDAQSVAALPGGAFLYVDSVNNLVREVSPKGTVTTVAGNGSTTDQDGVAPTQSGLNDPVAVAGLPDGSFLVTEYKGGVVRRVLPGPNSTIETIAGTAGQPGAPGSGIAGQTPLSYPTDAEPTADGQILIADSGSGRIWDMSSADPTAAIQTVAGGGSCDDRTVNCEGAAAGSVALHDPVAISPVNGGAAGYLIAEADPNGANAIRRVTQISPAATFSTVAGQPGQRYGYAGDGGPATGALLYSPAGVTSQPDGSFIIADTGNERIREVSASGAISTIAGTGTATYAGDGGAATSASLQEPSETAATTGGGLLIADASDGAIREITIPPTSTISFGPASAMGQNGWYLYDVNATVTTTPGAKLNCELDPIEAPPAYAAITPGCPFSSSSGPAITGDGVHTIYASAANAFGDQENPISASIKIDHGTPTVTCGKAPTFIAGARGAKVSATVSDSVSGPVAPVVSVAVPSVRQLGRQTVSVEGMNLAGRSSFADCPYVVLPRTLQPVPAFGWAVLSSRRFAAVKRLTVRQVPRGAAVSIRCQGSGCPFALARNVTGRVCRHHRPCVAQRPAARARRLELARLFAGERLAPRVVLTVTVTAPQTIGRLWQLSLRSGRRPAQKQTCLVAGSLTQPGACSPGRGHP